MSNHQVGTSKQTRITPKNKSATQRRDTNSQLGGKPQLSGGHMVSMTIIDVKHIENLPIQHLFEQSNNGGPQWLDHCCMTQEEIIC
jgi:hypothetical protein